MMVSLRGAPPAQLTGDTPATPPSSVDQRACSLHRGDHLDHYFIFVINLYFRSSISSSKTSSSNSSSSFRKSITRDTFEDNDEPYGTSKVSLDALK